MDIISNLAMGFETAFTLTNLLYCLLGCLLGTVIGVLPGLGPIATISMLLPLTYNIGPTTSIIMLAGIYYGAQYGGSTTAILLNTPGEASSVMTCIDGNALTKQGRAGIAILTAGIASCIAGLIATIVIAVFSSSISELAFKFGPAEYCAMMLLGLVSVSVLTTGDIVKGIAMALLGILIGVVGTDVNSGAQRFVFGIPDLADGIGFANVAVGVFGIAEAIKNLTTKNPPQLYRGDIKLWPTKEEIKRMIPSSLRGTGVGIFTGLIPGGGAALSSFAAYIFDKKVSKNTHEFGHGAVEGVAAPEAANNAAAQAGFIPLLSLGIPENAVMALMLGALMINGVQPGPSLIERQPELFWGLTVSMLIGNILLFMLNVPLVKIWVQLIRIPAKILYPIVLAVCAFGLYSVNNNINDIWIAVGFGALGYVFIVLDLEPAPLMLGLVLGPMLEEYFRRQMSLSQGSWMPFVERPISATILFIVFGFLIFGFYKMFSNLLAKK